MILKLKDVIKYNKPFRHIGDSSPNGHYQKTGHKWRLKDPDNSDPANLVCVDCKRRLTAKELGISFPDEWILQMDDDDYEFEQQARDILSGLNIKVKEGVG